MTRDEHHFASSADGTTGSSPPSAIPTEKGAVDDTVTLLIEQAQMASRRNRDKEARRLLRAALRHDPENPDALLWLMYLAEDGRASLSYLAQFLDAHPHHPHARRAIRWARRRTPTSRPADVPRSPWRRRADSRTYRGAILAIVGIVALIASGWLWMAGQPSTNPVEARAPQNAFARISPSATARPLIEIVQVLIPVFTLTPTATPTPVATPTALPTPSSAWVPVVGHPQTYNLSCESRSAADLAGYWGVRIDEGQFLAALGISDNPHVGFVGEVTMPPGSLPPYGYGVYAEPVAATMRDYGLDARADYELGLDGVKSELLAGRPVLVWATYGMEPREPIEWTSTDGRVSKVVPYMHTFLAKGFDDQGIFVIDAYDATTQYYPFETFLQAWGLFDQMAVVTTGTLE